METTTTTSDVVLNDDQLQSANTLLAYLAEHATSDWEQVLSQGLSPTEMNQATTNVGRACQALDIEAPHGAVVGGTGVAKADAGLTGEEGQIAIQVLKEQNRLVQSGRGRGKFLVVISPEPIAKGTAFSARDRIASDPEATPSPELTPGARIEQTVASMQSLQEEMERRMNQLARDVADLKESLTERPVISW